MPIDEGLSVSAAYHEAADMVMVEVGVYDASGDLREPEDFRSVTILLLKKSVTLQSTDALDKYYGNKDLRFRACFNHPAVTHGLEVQATVVSRDGAQTWRKRVPVVFEKMSPSENELGDNAGNVMDV